LNPVCEIENIVNLVIDISSVV